MEKSEARGRKRSICVKGEILCVLHTANTIGFTACGIDTDLHVIFDSLFNREVAPSITATGFSEIRLCWVIFQRLLEVVDPRVDWRENTSVELIKFFNESSSRPQYKETYS